MHGMTQRLDQTEGKEGPVGRSSSRDTFGKSEEEEEEVATGGGRRVLKERVEEKYIGFFVCYVLGQPSSRRKFSQGTTNVQ